MACGKARFSMQAAGHLHVHTILRHMCQSFGPSKICGQSVYHSYLHRSIGKHSASSASTDGVYTTPTREVFDTLVRCLCPGTICWSEPGTPWLSGSRLLTMEPVEVEFASADFLQGSPPRRVDRRLPCNSDNIRPLLPIS